MKIPRSEFVSRAGVHYAGYVFSTEGIIFRETASTDVGIDGQLEIVSPEGLATGMLIGIQVKSGDSFVDNSSREFSFRATQGHFQYWSNLSVPVIGVVYSPALQVASWFDLTMHSNEILENKKPLIIKQVLNQRNILKIGYGISQLLELIYAYYKQPLTKEYIEKLGCNQEQSIYDNAFFKEDSWKRLISVFFSSESDSEVIAEAGHNLSWYFPSVSDAQREQFKDRLQLLNLSELYRIFTAVKQVLEQGRDDVASLIADLISYKSDIVELLKQLQVQESDKWIVKQLIEYIGDLDVV